MAIAPILILGWFSQKQLVRGLEKAVQHMHKGETAEIVLRSDYAYGDAGRSPHVPPGASVQVVHEAVAELVAAGDVSSYDAAMFSSFSRSLTSCR